MTYKVIELEGAGLHHSLGTTSHHLASVMYVDDVTGHESGIGVVTYVKYRYKGMVGGDGHFVSLSPTKKLALSFQMGFDGDLSFFLSTELRGRGYMVPRSLDLENALEKFLLENFEN